MKRCQKCSRTFPDENQKFCTFDGGLLMADQPTFDPNRTILAPQMTSLPPVTKPPTGPVPPPATPAPPPPPSVPERDMSETIVAYRPAAVPETPAPAEPPPPPSGSQTAPDLTPPLVETPAAQTSRDLVPPAPTSRELPAPPPPPVPTAPAPPPPVPTAPAPPPPVPTAQRPQPQEQPPAAPPKPPPPDQQAPTVILPQPPPSPAQQAKPPKKRSILPWIIGILVVLLLGLVGIGVACYVFQDKIREFVNPYLGSNASPTPTPANENSNANSNTNESANTNSSTNSNNGTKNEPPAFVPPADAVRFSNSKDNLDGDLAEHYVGFSFYYPKTWTKDPKAGVRGASSFAQVDRLFSDSTGEFIQERARFRWYASKGTYDADLPDFTEHAKKVTDQLAKSLQNAGYEEVSRGETTVNTYKGYEVRFKGEFKNGNKSLPYWGRVIFLPPGSESEKTGVEIVMLATSYATGVTSAQDVGAKGELALILDSFRFPPRP